MSGAFGSSQWMYSSGAAGFYPYSIDQSLRFPNTAPGTGNAYLNHTPSSSGNRKTWTWSAWVKRSLLGDGGGNQNQLIWAAFTGADPDQFRFGDTNDLEFYLNDGLAANIQTNQLFVDVSSWYHIVLSVDTTQATASDRVKFYVNGEQVTSFSTATYPSQNHDTDWNHNCVHAIGQSARINNTQFFCGYIAEVNFIDGTALDASSFGETINGIWVPKQYSGSYGTNGFYLSFADSAAIGDDLSGNTNDWTANNLAASDVVPDSPTNNFATFNPLDQSGTTLTYSEGNLKAERTTTSFAQAYSSFSFDSGKWYAEFLLDTGNTGVGVIAGTTNPAANRYIGQDTYTYGFHYDGRKINSASYTAYGSAYTRAADGSGDVVGVYIDADNGDIYFSVNGTVQNSGTAAFTGVTGPFRFAIGSESNAFHIANFGQDDSFAGLKTSGSAAASDDNGNGVFYDAIGLSGYLAPCTANLPEPAIGPNSDTTSDQHFNTVLWSGNSTNNRSITTDHATDFVWIKKRGTTVQSHVLADSVRGTSDNGGTGNVGILSSNLTDAESTNSSDSGIASFDSTGFTIGAGSNTANADAPYQGTNASSHTYVGWSWKAGGTAVTNTDGSITSSVSANPDAGFSIVSFTGTGANATIGHGLSSAPEMIILKNRIDAVNWLVGSTYNPNGWQNYLNLNGTTSALSASTIWQDTAPTSSVFSVGSNSATNGSGDATIAYCFHSSDVCKVGKYVGNGSADGTFVFTGHRPSFLLIKETGNANSWEIYDTARDPDNVASQRLFPNSSAAEATTNPSLDILSNGFKARAGNTGINRSGGTYIYLAFGSSFKYSNAR